MGKNNGKSKGPDLPFSREQVQEMIELADGNIVAASKGAEVPYKTFYSWIEKYSLKPYPDQVKRRIVTLMFEKARQMAMDRHNPSERMLCKILDNWGRFIEFTPPVDNINVTSSIMSEEGEEEYKPPRDLMKKRDQSLGRKKKK